MNVQRVKDLANYIATDDSHEFSMLNWSTCLVGHAGRMVGGRFTFIGDLEGFLDIDRQTAVKLTLAPRTRQAEASARERLSLVTREMAVTVLLNFADTGEVLWPINVLPLELAAV